MTDPRSSPDDRMLRLNAAVDGELDAANWLELEREMEANPALAAKYRLLAATRDAIRRHAPRETAPPALAARIAALTPPPQAAAPAAAVVPLRRRSWFDRRALALAASVAALGFVAGAGLTSLRMSGPPAGVAQNLVSDFARAEIAGQPFDVASSDRHTVKPWLAGRTTISAEIIDLAAQGFPLAGGRVSVVDRVAAPTLVYRHAEHLIAVTELPPNAAGGRGDAVETIDGFHVSRWSNGTLSYVAVSDMDEKTLAEFVAAFRQAQRPTGEAPAR